MGNCTNGKLNECMDENSEILNKNDVKIIEESWKHVVEGGLREYGVNMMIRIFLEHRELKPLWKFTRGLETREEMQGSVLIKAHGEKLFGAIDMVIKSLNDLTTLMPILIQLGYSHHKWGVKDEHFPIVANALIGTLKDGLKEKFNEKVKKTWIKLFGILELQMKTGLRQAEFESNEKIVNINSIESKIINDDLLNKNDSNKNNNANRVVNKNNQLSNESNLENT